MKDHWIKLNHMELGYLMGAIPGENMARMKKEMPKMWLRLHIMATEAYAQHSVLGKRARQDLRNLKGRLHRIILKEAKSASTHV